MSDHRAALVEWCRREARAARTSASCYSADSPHRAEDVIEAENLEAIAHLLSASVEAREPACCVPAPDRSGRQCDKPAGHDGPHWTYGGDTLTWVEARETPAPPADLLAWAEKERDDWQDRNADRYWQMNRVVAEIKQSGAASERAASPEVEKARCGIEQPNIELCVRCGEPAADHGEFGFRDHAPRNAAGDELPTTVTAECAARAEVTALRDALTWVFRMLDQFEHAEAIHPHQTWTEYGEPQRQGWACYGCDGEFVSVWPEWKKPTLQTFPHTKDCKYVAVMAVLAATGATASSAPAAAPQEPRETP